MWIIADLAVRQYVRRFHRDDNLYKVYATLHFQITEIQAFGQFDAANLMIRHLLLYAGHQDVSDVTILVCYDFFYYFTKWQPSAVQYGNQFRRLYVIHRRKH